MMKSQAKRLKPGDRVVWDKDGVQGVVTRKRYNTVWIHWDDQPEGHERTHYADLMDHVFTPEQLARTRGTR